MNLDARAAKVAVSKHLLKLNASVNVTQYTAQLHEREMVELLVQMANDTEGMPPSIRRACANDVIVLARGHPRPWFVDPETVNPAAEGTAGFGATVGQEIEAVKLTVDLQRQLNELTSRNIHPSKWPAEVRAVASDMVAYYEDEESSSG
jgi:hypothetical protein